MSSFNIGKYSIEELELLKKRFERDGDKAMAHHISKELREKKIAETLRQADRKKQRDEAYEPYGYVPEHLFEEKEYDDGWDI